VFNGENILPAGNSNWSQLNDPRINAAMDEAARLPQGAQRDKAWGEIDKMVVGQAAAVPWFWDKQPLVTSSDVRAVVNEYNTSWDLAFSSMK
jgi:peptide/nickel transport system substrate-binding protein